ncbi:aminotransferase class I/II-fold pyridoxal phosphate-dependent enzyme [Candidatus Hodgkinia cicadicola]|uniref:aminotransferase class I/II-fold pyridoxal phosphate-dependent enzyme n=1 Tax=Candidatus Hodgkinia cicadicola TaxID=573658 RepID=UPI0024154EDB
MSSNEKPLGTSKLIRKKLQINHIKLKKYSNNIYKKLIQNIANMYNLNKKQIVLGNGSDEFLSLLCFTCLKEGDEVIISEHGFLLYKTQVLVARAVPVIIKDSNNKVNINNIIRSINTKTKMIFITMPTNPAGLFLTSREINQLSTLLKSTNILLILDMNNSEYVKDDRYSIKITTNIVIIKTLSKTYGLASLKLGWMYSRNNLIKSIEKIKSPLNINKITQITGSVVLSDSEQRRLSRSFNVFWLIKIIICLRKANFIIDRSYANFVVIKLNKKLPILLIENYIAKCNVNVRRMSEYKLFNSIRVNVGSPHENIKLINQFKKLKKQKFVLVTHKTEKYTTQYWKN